MTFFLFLCCQRSYATRSVLCPLPSALCPLPSALGATGHCALLSLLLCTLQQAGTYYLFSTSCAGNLIKELAHPLSSLCGRDTAFCTCTYPQAMCSSCMHAYLPIVTYSYANECNEHMYAAAYVHMAMFIFKCFIRSTYLHLHTQWPKIHYMFCSTTELAIVCTHDDLNA